MDPIDSAIRPLNHRALATKLSLGVEAYYWSPMGGGGVGRGGEGWGGEGRGGEGRGVDDCRSKPNPPRERATCVRFTCLVVFLTLT